MILYTAWLDCTSLPFTELKERLHKRLQLLWGYVPWHCRPWAIEGKKYVCFKMRLNCATFKAWVKALFIPSAGRKHYLFVSLGQECCIQIQGICVAREEVKSDVILLGSERREVTSIRAIPPRLGSCAILCPPTLKMFTLRLNYHLRSFWRFHFHQASLSLLNIFCLP